MKNIDKVRAMSAEELADLICNKGVNFCQNCRVEKYCEWGGEKDCSVVWAEWLNAKFEKPMPDLKVGDIIYSYYPKTDNKVRYVYLGGNVMWCDKDECFICFDDEMKVYVKWIVRKNEDFTHKIIWRADI